MEISESPKTWQDFTIGDSNGYKKDALDHGINYCSGGTSISISPYYSDPNNHPLLTGVGCFDSIM